MTLINENKTNINWYPGHMVKTKREIIEDLKLIDVVIEVLDSRIPVSSQNPDISELTRDKKKIIVLNKIDLAESLQNELWCKKLKEQGKIAVLVDSNQGKGIDELILQIQNIASEDKEKYEKSGRIGRKIKVMIIGVPNVGKSSLINRITKTSKLEVGNKPGVTKRKQWLSINENINLLDTPGVLWPKFQDEKIALNLAFTGTIKDDVLEVTEIAYQLLKFLLSDYKDKIVERYGLKKEYIDSVLSQNQEENINIYEIMQEIGKKRGALVSGGNIDDGKTAKIILEDFRTGKMGRITIERAN